MAVPRLWVNISLILMASPVPHFSHHKMAATAPSINSYPHTTTFKCRKMGNSLCVFLLRREGISFHLTLLDRVTCPQLSCEEGWKEHLECFGLCKKEVGSASKTTRLPQSLPWHLSLLRSHSGAISGRKPKSNLWAFNPSRQQLKLFSSPQQFLLPDITLWRALSANCFGSTQKHSGGIK